MPAGRWSKGLPGELLGAAGFRESWEKNIGYMNFDQGAKQIIRTLIQGAVSHKHVCNRTRTTNCKIDGAQQ